MTATSADDACDKKTGCSSKANAAKCDDGNACTSGDKCANAQCIGASVNCDDNNPCTTDSCATSSGCSNVNNAEPCSDGSACTLNDTCKGGACAGGPAANCDDGNPCTDDKCDKTSGCQSANNTATCDDGNSCTESDVCISGTCKGKGKACSDGNLCTADSCDPGKGCVFTNTVDPCSDGNACTLNDKCSGGSCSGGTAAKCDDGNVCTTDSCDAKTGCKNEANTNACNDNNACTSNDVCAATKCVGKKVTCDDGQICTDDFCDVVAGCKVTNNSVACDDGTACTSGDKCAAGQCVGVPVNCDDQNPCTSDSCNANNGCSNTNVADNTKCGGVGICQSGQCSKGSEINPALSCKEILAGWPAAPSGTYWLDPDGPSGAGGKYQVLCEMKDFGGGWMVIDNQWLFNLTTLKNLIPGGKCVMTAKEWRTWDQFDGSTANTHFCSANNKYSHWPTYTEMRQVGVRLQGYTASKSDSFDAYTNCYGSNWQGSFCFGPSAEMYSMTTKNISLVNGQNSPTYNQLIKLKKAANDFEFRSREEGPQKEGILWTTGKIYLR